MHLKSENMIDFENVDMEKLYAITARTVKELYHANSDISKSLARHRVNSNITDYLISEGYETSLIDYKSVLKISNMLMSMFLEEWMKYDH